MNRAVPKKIMAWESPRTGIGVRAAYEHPFIVRACHWLNSVALLVLIASGLRIYLAFPSFGPKIPQHNFVTIPKQLTIGGWLGGALQWHFTFLWIYIATGVIYVGYQILSGNLRQVLFMPRDIRGVWPMARHYFLLVRSRNFPSRITRCRSWRTLRRFCWAFSPCSRAWCS